MKDVFDGQEFIFFPGSLADVKETEGTFLIPDYDEYGISYKDRSIYNHPEWRDQQKLTHADYSHALTVNGYFGGNWKRQVKGKNLEIALKPFTSLTKTQQKSVENAKLWYLAFFN